MVSSAFQHSTKTRSSVLDRRAYGRAGSPSSSSSDEEMSPSTPAPCSGTCNAASIRRHRHAKDRGGRPGAHRRNRRVHQDRLRLCLLHHLPDTTSHEPKKLNMAQASRFLRTGCVAPNAPLATFRDQLIISLSRTSTARIESLPSPTCTTEDFHYGHAQAPTDAKSSHLGKALLVGRDLGRLPLKLRHVLRQLQLSQAQPIQKRVSRTCKRMVAFDGQSRAASRTGRIRPAPCPAPGRRCIA